MIELKQMSFGMLMLVFFYSQPALANETKLPVAEIILTQATKFLPADALDVQVRDLSLPTGLPALLNPKEVLVRFRLNEDFTGDSLVQLNLQGRTRWIKVDFQQTVLSAVAKRDLTRGHALAFGDMKLMPIARRSLGNCDSGAQPRLGWSRPDKTS